MKVAVVIHFVLQHFCWKYVPKWVVTGLNLCRHGTLLKVHKDKQSIINMSAEEKKNLVTENWLFNLFFLNVIR